MIHEIYSGLAAKHEHAREMVNRPLTLSEKILYSQLCILNAEALECEKTYSYLSLNKIAIQDVTAQMALLRVIRSGRLITAVPSSTPCNHLMRAQSGATEYLECIDEENGEVYELI